MKMPLSIVWKWKDTDIHVSTTEFENYSSEMMYKP